MNHAPRDSPRASPTDPGADQAADQGRESAWADELAELTTEIEGLRRALETRPTIDLAKGMVMHRYLCTDDAAFALLQRVSQEHNVKIRDLAAAIVARVDGDGVDGHGANGHGASPATASIALATMLFEGPRLVDGDGSRNRG